VSQVLGPAPRGPVGVGGLDGYKEDVERPCDGLRIVQVRRLYGDGVIAAGACQAEPPPTHRLHVLGPLVDQRDVVSRLREQPADHAPDGARPEDPESGFHGPIAYTPSLMSGIHFDHIAIAVPRIADAPPYLMGVLGGAPSFG